MPLHAATLTAFTLEPLDRYSTLYLVGGDVRQATTTDFPTHYAPRQFNGNVSAAIIAFEPGHRYRCVLSGSCVKDQDLLQDVNGQLSPVAAGPKVGRAAYGGAAGDIIEFIFETAGGTGGGGVTPGEVNQLITLAVNRSFDFFSAADDVPPTDADWPEGTPNENDIIEVIRTPVSRKRTEYWQRGATDNWTKIQTVTDAGTSKPERSEFRATSDILAGLPIDMNAATPALTTAIGLDYTSHDSGTAATFNDIYGRDLMAYVNGTKVEQDQILRSDGDPAGWIRLNFDVPVNSELVFESQVLS